MVRGLFSAWLGRGKLVQDGALFEGGKRRPGLGLPAGPSHKLPRSSAGSLRAARAAALGPNCSRLRGPARPRKQHRADEQQVSQPSVAWPALLVKVGRGGSGNVRAPASPPLACSADLRGRRRNPPKDTESRAEDRPPGLQKRERGAGWW